MVLWAPGPAVSSEAGASLVEVTDTARPYLLHMPGGDVPEGGWPLVVVLHGCLQNGLDAAHGTRWLEAAEREGFIAVFPSQTTNANGMQCWNWFDRAHQQRGAGEPAILAGIAQSLIDAGSADPDRVYAVGMSAGADMVAILAATYPDVFAAVAAVGGCAYSTCADVTGALAYVAMGEHARVVPSMVVQGDADPLNNVAMGETLVRQQVGTADHADDGEANGSVASLPTSVDHVEAVESGGGPGSGEPCVRNNSYPCLAGAVGWETYPYTVSRYTDGADRVVVESWLIHGLMHNWPGGRIQEENPRTTFVDPHGPDITSAMWSFFLQNPR
jgi:poly(hydroxyalkanoate) depolymerase family esterase